MFFTFRGVWRMLSGMLVFSATTYAETFPCGWSPTQESARVGSVGVNAQQKMVTATGYVNQTNGPIELLACGPGGKRHESIFVLELNPLDLQTALLLIGAKAGEPMKQLGAGPPKGTEFELWVGWMDGETQKCHRVESFIYDHELKKPMSGIAWIFTGSTFEEGQFKALAEESLVATFWDPWSIFNIGSEVGANDERVSVHGDPLPTLHTPITMYFKLREK